MSDPERLSSLVAFATAGTLSVTQELAARAVAGIEGADAQLVAEETLALVSTASARAAAFGLREEPGPSRAASMALADLPAAYHDYLVGIELLSGTPESGIPDDLFPRLERKSAFYRAHIREGEYPGPRAMADVMALWMGRISPPRLPEMPQARLERLALVPILERHVRLVRARAESGA